MSSEALNQKFLYIPKPALVASAILHGSVLAFFLVVQVLGHFGINVFSKKPPIDTKALYQDFIQVDVVALPDQMFSDQVDTTLPIVDKPGAVTEPVKEAEPAKTEEAMADPQEMALKAEAEKKAAAKKAEEAKAKAEKAEREKAMKALQEEARREAALKELAKAGKKGRAALKGNKLSAGTGTTGMIGTPSDRWGSLLMNKIRSNFTIFPWMRQKKLETVVFIKIYQTGRIRERKMVKPSADGNYNSAVLQAIEASQPLPVPDEPSLYEDGITLTFRSQE